jgi:hypothetical protein
MIGILKSFLKKNETVKKVVLFGYKNTVEKYFAYRRNKLFLKNGVEVLLQIDKAFRDLDIKYWLEFGTLLGAVREKGFIEHDNDIDLACFFDNYNEENEKVFNKYGFIKTRSFLIDNGKFGREETYSLNGVDIDIFYFHRRENEMYCHLFKPLPGKGWDSSVRDNENFLVRELSYPFRGFKSLSFYNHIFNIPENIYEHLSASYGKNYMIKDANYSNSIATNVRILKDKFGKGYLHGRD